MKRWMTAVWVILLLVAAMAADPERKGKQSAAGTGHVIRLEAGEKARWIDSVRIHGARYGEGYDPAETTFRLAICGEDLRVLHEMELAYDRFEAGRFTWATIPLDRTFEVPDRFAIVAAFDPTATKGVFIGWSEPEGASRSGYGLPGGTFKPTTSDREWMIRAELAKRAPKGVPKMVELAQEDGAKTGEKSISGGSHTVTLKKPSGTWWFESIRVYGKRYGGGFNPEATAFVVSIRNTRGKVLHQWEAPYSLFERDAFHWADVRLPKALKVPSKFQVDVSFRPTRTKGVYVGMAYALLAKRMRDAVITMDGSTWMIRAVAIDAKPSPAPKEKSKRTVDYAKDLGAIAKTVKRHFPAFEKKGVDWDEVVRRWRPAFQTCPDDRAHVLNARRLLAELGDMHTGVIDAKVEAHVPSFDGLYGAGLWIAHDEGRLLLRAMVPGHPLEGTVPRGATLLTIDGRPAGEVHAETRKKLKTWSGWSSDHFLDARLSFQFFPFGERQRMEVEFEGGAPVTISRWGPAGRGLSRQAVTMPDGVEAKGKAVSAMLDDDVGYVRILSGMDESTRKAFDEALKVVKGAKGILLDCRGMGGGGDPAAWAMAGRFFKKKQELAYDPALKPTGPWQFEGPVVMLQDERMVSSAETFTWAMGETGRALTVGRPTGGATIIPRVFDVPSGLFRFRLGCRDRETSVEGIHPEGIGSPPEVFVGYDSETLREERDPILAEGLRQLRARL